MKIQFKNSLKGMLALLLMAIVTFLSSCKGREASADASKPAVEPPAVDIHTAVLTGNIEALKQHIAAGSNLNEKDPFGGSSPLISAALFGKTEEARLLIDAGADLNFQNNDGATALHTAAFFCRTEVVNLLLEKGADKTLRNKFGATAYESVAGPFTDVKNTYDIMGKVLAPMGLKLDFEHIEKTRPVIAAMLK